MDRQTLTINTPNSQPKNGIDNQLISANTEDTPRSNELGAWYILHINGYSIAPHSKCAINACTLISIEAMADAKFDHSSDQQKNNTRDLLQRDC